jgi:hypothetical protein
MGDLSKPALTVALMDKLESKGKLTKKEMKQLKSLLDRENRNQGGAMKKYNKGGQGYAAREDESLGMRTGAERTKSQSMRDRRDESYGAFGKRPNQRINRGSGGGTPSKSISNKDAMEMAKEAMMTPVTLGSNTISDSDVKFLDKVVKGKAKKNKTPKHRGTGPQNNAKGGVAKNYAHGGVEAADEEGSRLSISMERQEDAGYSPSEADFDKQHSLAEEGIMEVGADVKIIQGYNSRASLGETEGVRGTGAMVKGTKFRGSF